MPGSEPISEDQYAEIARNLFPRKSESEEDEMAALELQVGMVKELAEAMGLETTGEIVIEGVINPYAKKELSFESPTNSLTVTGPDGKVTAIAIGRLTVSMTYQAMLELREGLEEEIRAFEAGE